MDERVAALKRLQGEAASRFQASQRLKAIDALLFLPADFYESDLQRILRKSKYPRPIEKSIKLYVMMACLTPLCEPTGSATGPACWVKLIDFENLTLDSVLDVKGTAGFRLFFSLPLIINKPHPRRQLLFESPESGEIDLRWHKYEYGSKFNALDSLSAEQKDLYYRAKPFFGGRKKPTLQSLAAYLLKDPNDKGYSERSVSRYLQAFRELRFADEDIRRTFLIHTVDSFGEEKRSMRQIYADIFPELVTTVQRAIQSAVTSLNPFLTQLQSLFASIADQLRLTLPSKGSQN